MMVWLDTSTQQEGEAERELRPRADGALSASASATTPRRTSARRRRRSPATRSRTARAFSTRGSTTTARRPSSARAASSRATDIVRICLEQDVVPALHRPQAVPLPGQRVGRRTGRTDRPARRAVPRIRLRHRQAGRDDPALEPVLLADTPTARRSSRRSSSRSASCAGWRARPARWRWPSALEGLGQVLFAPPSVKGWDGGAGVAQRQTLLVPPEPRAGVDLDRGRPLRQPRPTRPGSPASIAKTPSEQPVDFLPRCCSCKATCPAAPRAAARLPRRPRTQTPPVYWTEDEIRRPPLPRRVPPGADAAGVSTGLICFRSRLCGRWAGVRERDHVHHAATS